MPGEPVTISQLPAVVNVELYAGDSLEMSVAVTDADGYPFDLDGWTARSQIRETPESGTVEAELTATVDQATATITLFLTAADSAGLPRQAVWDVEISRDPVVTTLAAGTVTVTPEVTR